MGLFPHASLSANSVGRTSARSIISCRGANVVAQRAPRSAAGSAELVDGTPRFAGFGMAAGEAPPVVTRRDKENLAAVGETHPGYLGHRSVRRNRRLVPHEGDYSAVVDDLIGKHDGPDVKPGNQRRGAG